MGGGPEGIAGPPQSPDARERGTVRRGELGTVRLEVLVALLLLFLFLLVLPVAL
jgi:hypothetical protein